MRKSPLGFVSWLVGGIRDALRHPPTDRAAKVNVITWSVLLVIVGMNLAMMSLLNNVGPITIGFTIAGAVIYAVCLKQALRGLRYRMKLRAVADDRKAFEQIVNGL